jgi:predicted TIM-barrel fold metal-dependent hydrolase
MPVGPSRTIIDAHMHLYRSKEEGERAKHDYQIWEYGDGAQVSFADWHGDVEDGRMAMARCAVSAAVITNMLGPQTDGSDLSRELVEYNEWLSRLCQDDRRFIPAFGFDPNCLGVVESVAHIRSLADVHPVAAVKMHPSAHGYDVADERIWPLFEMSQSAGLRIICHSGPSSHGGGIGEPQTFRPVLESFPRLRLVLAHMGGAAWPQSAEIAHEFPFVRFDCSEIIHWLGAQRAPSVAEFVTLVREIGADRVMMGSDFPWYDISDTVRLVDDLPDLSAGEKAAMLGATAERFFDVVAASAAAD